MQRRFTVPYSGGNCLDANHPQCNIGHERMALEARIIRFTLRALKRAGWQPFSAHDGQEWITTETETAVLQVAFSVDESQVWVRHKDGRKSWFGIILGNGVDCVGGDYGSRLDNIISAAYDTFSAWK